MRIPQGKTAHSFLEVPGAWRPIRIAYEYLGGRTSGDLVFDAPGEAGAFDLRMNSSDAGGQEVASVSFTVGALTAESMESQIQAGRSVVVYGIKFDSGKADIRKDSMKPLAEIGRLLIKNDDLKLGIEGHTDNQGDAKLNQDLSLRRAASVKQYLIDTFGIEPARLTTAGYGDTRPLGPNDTDARRAQNRRVELIRQ